MAEKMTNEQVSGFIEDRLKKGDTRPVFVKGAPGDGKVSSLRKFMYEDGTEYLELHLDRITADDMLEAVTHGKGHAITGERILPDKKPDGKGMLVFDGIDACVPYVKSIMYAFMKGNVKMADYALPDGWLPVGVTNGSGGCDMFEEIGKGYPASCSCIEIVK